jgi:hypothetical protein
VRVIFLDIDGVLNSESFGRALEDKHRQLGHGELERKRDTTCNCFAIENQIDDAAVARLNRLVAQTEAKIVISSSWRKLFDLAELKTVLLAHGLVAEIIGVTPNAFDETTRFDMTMEYGATGERLYRGHEIDYWLRYQGEGVVHFVILDDGSDMEMHSRRLVQTDPDIGLCDDDVGLAIRMLEWDGATSPSPIDQLLSEG